VVRFAEPRHEGVWGGTSGGYGQEGEELISGWLGLMTEKINQHHGLMERAGIPRSVGMGREGG